MNIYHYFFPLVKKYHALNIIYTLMVGFLAVCFWRGTWIWFDLVMLPNRPLASLWASFAIGVVLCVCAHLLQHFVIKPFIVDKNRHHNCISRVVGTIFVYLIAVGTINYWRCVFYFWDYYILYDNPTLSAWFSVIVGILGSIITLSSRSLIAVPFTSALDSNTVDLILPVSSVANSTDENVLFMTIKSHLTIQQDEAN